MSANGILAVDKPVGTRSTDCVQKLRRIFGKKIKTGHAGTLDSTASGLLLILVGQATRLSEFLMGLPKRYEGTVTFGSETDTDDASGEAIRTAPWRHITQSEVERALCGFLGCRMQSPPSVSAVHINGERAHHLARSGLKILPAAKPVIFTDIKITSPLNAEGSVTFEIGCRRGTYIRSFARDLGQILGSAAHLSALRRSASGPFTVEKAFPAEKLYAMNSEELTSCLLPVESLCKSSASYRADEIQAEKLINGLPVKLSSLQRISLPVHSGDTEKIIVTARSLFSICRKRKTAGSFELRPAVNLISSEEATE